MPRNEMVRLFFILSFFIPIFARADSRRADLVNLINLSDIRGVQPTGSMKPVLDEHCLLLVHSIPFKNLKQGDIILFNNPDGLLVVHRIWRISKPEGHVILTRGDNNGDTIDPWYVTEREYVGTVVGIIRADLMEKVLTQDKISAQ